VHTEKSFSFLAGIRLPLQEQLPMHADVHPPLTTQSTFNGTLKKRGNMLTKKIIIIAISIVLASAFIACEQEGPAEEAGEKIDEAAEETAEAVEEAGETVEEKAEEVKEKAKEQTQ
jgi:hypothetical protein